MTVRGLAWHDLPVSGGINSAYEPESETMSSVRDIQNMDWYAEFRALAKLPGSSDVASADVGNPIDSIHYFEFIDLDGVRKRHYICLAGGNLYTISPGVGFTSVHSGTLGSQALRTAKASNRFHFSSPEITGEATGGVKYDGTRVTSWGILAPGQEETIKDALDTNAGWVDNANATSATDSSISFDGSGSIKVAKDGTAGTACQIYKTSLTHDLTTASDGFVYLYVFLGSGMLQNLATSGTALRVQFGTGGSPNSDEHNFSVGELLPSWNILSIDTNNPDAQNGAGATLNNITYMDMVAYSKAAATTWTDDKLRWDNLFHLSDGDCDAATGAAGQISAAVTYRITFATEYGVESNLGPASSTVTPSSEQVDLTNIPVSGDGQVLARRIYRDKDADAIFRFVDQIDDNVTTSYTDNIADASLGGAIAPIAGDSLLDSTPPPRFSAVVEHGERIWGVDARSRSIIWISDLSAPEQFRLVDQISMEDDIEAFKSSTHGLYAYSTDRAYLISGDGVTSAFRSDLVGPQLGVNGFRSIADIKALHVVVREAEMFQVVNPADPWFFNGPVLDKFRALTPSTLADSFIVHDRKRFRILFFDGTEDVFCYQYATSGSATISTDGAVDPLDVRNGRWSVIKLPALVDPNDAVVVEQNADEPEVWLAGNDGRVYLLTDDAVVDWANDGGTSAMAAHVEFHAVPLGAGMAGRGEPRYIELQTNSVTGGTVTATFTLLDGADGNTLDTQTKDFTIPAGTDSQIIACPEMGMAGPWCRVKLACNTSGEDFGLRKVRLYYIPRSGFRGEQT